MEKYVTVVSVDDQPPVDQPKVEEEPATAEDSQFVTVLSINHGSGRVAGEGVAAGEELEPELVLVYRLPGERLGFGLKFQGGTKNNEKIQRLFIQSCAENSPASRVQASWGFLREGDEILEIDGVSVTRMTRIECVRCLKESNLAIKLLVRNGEGKVQNFYDENGDVPERKSVPPPPPPVPPRKLNKRKVVEKVEEATPPKQVVEIVQPPDAEVYSNLFSDDISDLISESDDTASTISTVIDKYSICSSLSSEDYTISAVPTNLELAKALKPFTLLEKEFNLENKLETALFPFPPSTVNVVQLEVEAEPNEYENVTIAKVDENRNYENVIQRQASDHQPANYENVTIQAVIPEPPSQPYENVVISQDSTQPDSSVYENVDLKEPPRPLPRQVEPMKRTTTVVAPPRQKSPKAPAPPIPKTQPHHHPNEFNTIQTWLQEATEVIHECALADPPKEPDNLPRLIDFHPKVSSPAKSTTTIAVDPEPEPIVKKCIKIVATNGSSPNHNYIESSSSEEDEDEEKSYELVQPGDGDDGDADTFEDSLGGGDDDSGAFDAYSDEDGEKLGPPEIVAGGPSEAYFNFHWTTTLLPPIGEVEEEFSSLENQAVVMQSHQQQQQSG